MSIGNSWGASQCILQNGPGLCPSTGRPSSPPAAVSPPHSSSRFHWPCANGLPANVALPTMCSALIVKPILFGDLARSITSTSAAMGMQRTKKTKGKGGDEELDAEEYNVRNLDRLLIPPQARRK